MQGDQLVPGGKNVLAGGADLHAPYRLGRDRPLNPLKNLGKSPRGEVGAHFPGVTIVVSADLPPSLKEGYTGMLHCSI